MTQGDSRRQKVAGPELQGLPKRLSDLLTAQAMTQGTLASRCGVHQSMVSRIARGERLDGITCETAIRLAKGLGVSMDYLLCGRGMPRISSGSDGNTKTMGRTARSSPSPEHLIVEPSAEDLIIEAAKSIIERRRANALDTSSDRRDPRPAANKHRRSSRP